MISSSATTQDAASQQAMSVTVGLNVAIIPTNGIAVNAILFITVVNSLQTITVVSFHLFSHKQTLIQTTALIFHYYCIASCLVRKLSAPWFFPAFYPRLDRPTEWFTFSDLLCLSLFRTPQSTFCLLSYLLSYSYTTRTFLWRLLFFESYSLAKMVIFAFW